jgi:hypothetical protein
LQFTHLTLSSPWVIRAESFPQIQTPLTKDKAGSTQVHVLALTLAFPFELMVPSHVTHTSALVAIYNWGSCICCSILALETRILIIVCQKNLCFFQTSAAACVFIPLQGSQASTRLSICCRSTRISRLITDNASCRFCQQNCIGIFTHTSNVISPYKALCA